MSEGESRTVVSYLGLFAASFLISLGTYWAFSRGANDFTVFYTAWDHVLHGRGMEIYRSSPDRFLYAPGFAWLFSPLALLPREAALAAWCFLKAGLVGWMVREFSKALLPKGVIPSSSFSILAAGITAWGVVLVARPLLIDFQYGQVNLLILGACVWALARHAHIGPDRPWQDFLSWAWLGVAAVGKLFPIPLLIVPFFVPSFGGIHLPVRKLWRERAGLVLGVALTLFLPMASVGPQGTLSLMQQWKQALVDRGFPLESHNQSFGAFLHHYASGESTEIIAQHRRQLRLGGPVLSSQGIALLSMAWSVFFAGLALCWILAWPAAGRDPSFWARDRWIAVIAGLMVLPSHLIWKPYFVMGLPAAFLAIRKWESGWPRALGILFAFLVMNFSGFDVLGSEWGARFEAASAMLWAHLLLLWIASTRSGRMISDISP